MLMKKKKYIKATKEVYLDDSEAYKVCYMPQGLVYHNLRHDGPCKVIYLYVQKKEDIG